MRYLEEALDDSSVDAKLLVHATSVCGLKLLVYEALSYEALSYLEEALDGGSVDAKLLVHVDI